MEPTIEQDAMARPQEVTRGIQILSGSLAIGLLKSLFNLAQRTSGVPLILASLIVIAVFSIGFLLVCRISAVRWVKAVKSILLVLSAALAVLALMDLVSAKYVAAIGFAVASVLAYVFYKRRNWARIILLVLILFGLPFAIMASLAELKQNIAAGSLSIVIAVLQLLGVVLLFTKNSNLWFRRNK
jgi:membrane-associated HD superfamily phosphohydrolase